MFAITYKENGKSFVIYNMKGQLEIYDSYTQALRELAIIADMHEDEWDKEKIESLSVEALEVCLK